MLQFGLIGVGSWGRKYLSTMQSFRDARIKYLCANSTKTLQIFKRDYITTTDYKELLLYPDIDGIIIATSSATHFEIAKIFIKKGYHLLIEKPLVESYTHSLTLHSLQKKKKSKVIVGHTYLFDPAYKRAKELVAGIGPIRYISYEGTNNGPYRSGTSTLWDVGPHAISLCLDVSQKKPVQVSAWAISSLKKEFYDFAFIKIMFSDRSAAFIKISWLFPLKKRELVIVGKKNTVIYDAVAKKKVTYFKNMIHDKNNSLTEVQSPGYDSKTPLEIEIQEFIDVVTNKNKNTYSNLDTGVNVTKLISLAEKSIKQNGKPIDLN